MKGDMGEVLIAPVTMGYRQQRQHDERVGWSMLRTLGVTSLIIIVALSVVRYEGKIRQLETRLEILETESIIKETLGLQVKVSDLAGGEIRFINPTGSESKSESRQKRDADPRNYSPPPVRNDQEETFFTKGRHGPLRPSGLREIAERLPPTSEEVGYQSPPLDYFPAKPQPPPSQLQTRSLSTSGRVHAPRTQIGTGSDQVSARVIHYRDSDSGSGYLTDGTGAPSNTNVNIGHFGDSRGSSSYVAPSTSTLHSHSNIVAGHFVADVSNFTSSDNPRLRNANGIFQIWRPATWMSGNNFILDSKDGVVTVQKGGIFHIYAQIHYHDEQQNSFIVDVNGVPLIQCTTQNGSNSCFTAGLAELKRGDRIVIKNVGVDRFSIYKPEKSFFGLVKVGN